MRTIHRPSAGFQHNGRTVFALEYELGPPAGFTSAFLIVWLTPEGADANGFTMHSDPAKWIVQARAAKWRTEESAGRESVAWRCSESERVKYGGNQSV